MGAHQRAEGERRVELWNEKMTDDNVFYLQGDVNSIPVMLVGNKCDESTELREVSQIEGQAQATTWGISFMETSAKTNHNVTELFQELLNMEKTRSVSLQLDTKKQKKQKKEKKCKETNGAIPENGEASASGAGVKEKCGVM